MFRILAVWLTSKGRGSVKMLPRLCRRVLVGPRRGNQVHTTAGTRPNDDKAPIVSTSERANRGQEGEDLASRISNTVRKRKTGSGYSGQRRPGDRNVCFESAAPGQDGGGGGGGAEGGVTFQVRVLRLEFWIFGSAL